MQSDLTKNIVDSSAAEVAAIEAAWVRWSNAGACPYCRHPGKNHQVGANVPVYFRPALEHESGKRQHFEPTLEEEIEGAPTPYLVRERLGSRKVVSEVYCGSCARDLRTGQVMCYRRIIGLGETVRLDGRVIYPPNGKETA